MGLISINNDTALIHRVLNKPIEEMNITTYCDRCNTDLEKEDVLCWNCQKDDLAIEYDPIVHNSYNVSYYWDIEMLEAIQHERVMEWWTKQRNSNK